MPRVSMLGSGQSHRAARGREYSFDYAASGFDERLRTVVALRMGSLRRITPKSGEGRICAPERLDP